MKPARFSQGSTPIQVIDLVPGADGAFPQFANELAPLNVPGERGRVAAGLVVRHRISGAEITAPTARKASSSR
jgi:hypothetical protein